MSDARVLVTGASGFVGRALAESLSADFEVFAPTHAELELTDGEAVDSYLRSHSVDAIVHGAFKPGHRNAVDPTGLVEANTRMYLNLTRREERCTTSATTNRRWPNPVSTHGCRPIRWGSRST
jgi:dTDP-4-dehydrorhamnose reductase